MKLRKKIVHLALHVFELRLRAHELSLAKRKLVLQLCVEVSLAIEARDQLIHQRSQALQFFLEHL